MEVTMNREPESKEIDGIVYFAEPYEISTKEWYSMHDESDFIADDLGNHIARIYCYALDASFNQKLEKVAKEKYKDKVIFNGIGVAFGGIWI